MSIPLGADTVTILRPAAADWQGDPTADGTEHDITGCLVQPSGSQETNAGGDTITSGWQVHAPPGADVTGSDRARLPNGDTGEVDGQPEPWHDDLGIDSHVLFMVRVTKGQ